MERLTGRKLNSLGGVYYINCNQENCHGDCSGCVITHEVELKLKEYEDLEERGLLLRLPCVIGAPVYRIVMRFPGSDDCENPSKWYEIQEQQFKLDMLDKFGKKIFLTREEAEEKLSCELKK